MTIKVNLIYSEDGVQLAELSGYCATRDQIPRLMEHLLATSVAQSVHKGGTFQQVTVTLSNTGGARVLSRDLKSHDLKPHMVRSPVLRLYTNLLEFIDRTMPDEVQGLTFMKTQLHQTYMSWHDNKISSGEVRKFVDESTRTVRLWLGEWLMGKLERHDFTGREERLFIQSKIAAYKRGSITLQAFDKALVRSLDVLKKLS